MIRSFFSSLLILAIVALGAAPLTARAGNGDAVIVVKSGTAGDTATVVVPFVANSPLVFGTSSGTAATAPFTILSGTNTAGTLPAATPNTYFYSLSASGSTAAVYVKLTGTGTTGWYLATSGTAQ